MENLISIELSDEGVEYFVKSTKNTPSKEYFYNLYGKDIIDSILDDFNKESIELGEKLGYC